MNKEKNNAMAELVKVLNKYDKETASHVKRTGIIGAVIAKEFGMNDIQSEDLILLCILHDIGKTTIPIEILNKPGKLNDEEWEIMKTHSENGSQMVSKYNDLKSISIPILHHHERWDGTGYPEGLKENDIPFLSRIIAVTDAYDAMTNDRPYRKQMSEDEAIKELKVNAGKMFDPDIVDKFIELIKEDKIRKALSEENNIGETDQ